MDKIQGEVMSEENSQAGSQAEENTSSGTDKEQFVPRKAYEDVSKDMHKNKLTVKEQAAYIAELEAKQTAIEEAALAKDAKWKELYEKRDSEFESLKNDVQDRDRKYLEAVKRNALKNELGGKIKDQYLIHANLDGITFDENNQIEMDSLVATANSFRESHSELIPVQSSPQSTGMAAPTNYTSNLGNELKPLSKMSHQEKKVLLNSPELQAEYKKQGLL